METPLAPRKSVCFFFYWTIGQRLTTMAPDGNWRFDEFLDALICPSVPETRWCRTCARAPPWPPRWGTGWTGASRSTRWGSRTPACWSCVASGARPGNCKRLLSNLHLTPKSIFLKIQQILVANFYTLGNQFSTYKGCIYWNLHPCKNVFYHSEQH